MDEIIRQAYYDPRTGFTDAKKLHKKLVKQGRDYTLDDVKRVIKKQSLAQMFKPLPRYKKEFRSINVPSIRFQYQCDLLDMSTYVKYNSGYKWAMNCVDVYSRYAISIPMKSKELKSIMPAFKTIINTLGAPLNLNTDLEPAMMGAVFAKYLGSKKVRHWKNDPELKRNNSIVERFNRTLREVLQKYFYSRDTKRWVTILPDIVFNYNSTDHTTTKETPISIWEGKEPNRQKIRMPLPSKLKIGDVVRMLKCSANMFVKRTMQKTYTKNLYTITGIQGNTYVMVNEKGVIQKRKAFEIQKVDPSEIEDVKIDPKGEGKDFKKEVTKQRATRKLRKADIKSDLTESFTKPKETKRKRKPVKKLDL